MPRKSFDAYFSPCSLFLLAFCWTASATAVFADPYTLVSEDKIKLRVVEWRSADSKYASSEAIGGTYTVDASGNVSIPIAGRLIAVGKTIDELADIISSALSEKADLPSKPFVALEIAEYAPVFVVGGVDRPGRYPFDPGMTVLKAVSVAGGFVRVRGENATFERDRIQAAGDYRTATLSRRDLLMRKARLSAEIAGQPIFETPAELVGVADIDALKTKELDLMRLRRVQLQSRIAAAEDLSQLYSQEIQTLSAKIVTQKRQIDLSQQELDTVSGLVSKGLTNNARQFSADRGLAEAQSRQLDLEIALTRAKQSLSESNREKLDIVNKQNAENQGELNSIEIAIRKTAIDLQVAQLLGDQAGLNARTSQMGMDELTAGMTERSYKIVRRNDDGTDTSIDASETTAVLPHDLIQISTQGSSRALAMPSPSQPTSRKVANATPATSGQDVRLAKP